jgi:signal transduction histidine kinase
MKLQTRLFFWYGGALVAALLVLLAHAAYEIHEHGSGRGLEDTEASEIIVVELAVGVPLMAIGLAISWRISRGTVQRLQSLTAAASGLHAGDFQLDLPAAGAAGDELDRLAEVLRDMAQRLDTSFTQVRDFTLNASHELKTPLTVMRGEVETELREAPPEAARQEWMESLLEEIDRLARVVDGLTFLAKVDAGQIPMNMERLDLCDLVGGMAEDAQFLANPKGLTLDFSPPDRPILIKGDRHRLRQLLLNLADNAVKYNLPGGFVRIRLSMEASEAVLEVTNPGPGIPVGLEQRVFERFLRGYASQSEASEGSGLGLNIAQWIVQGHDGTIKLATGPDALTRMTVRLPGAFVEPI